MGAKNTSLWISNTDAVNEELTLKLELPCMLGADTSWWMTDRFRAKVARAPWRLSPTVLQREDMKSFTAIYNDVCRYPILVGHEREEAFHGCMSWSHPHWAQTRRSVSQLHITLYVVIPPLLGTEEKKYFSATHDAVCHDPTIVEHIRDKAFHSYTWCCMSRSYPCWTQRKHFTAIHSAVCCDPNLVGHAPKEAFHSYT